MQYWSEMWCKHAEESRVLETSKESPQKPRFLSPERSYKDVNSITETVIYEYICSTEVKCDVNMLKRAGLYVDPNMIMSWPYERL